jgi:DNA-directed RNA polymerase specialized sigma subunit
MEIQKDIVKLVSRKEAYVQTMSLSGIRYDQVKVKTSPRDRMPEYAARLEKLDNSIDKRRKDWTKACDRVTSLTKTLNSTEALIIEQHYLKGMTFTVIAAGIPLSESQTYKIRKAAIEKLEKTIVKRSIHR